jgi:hypothetical protein
VRLAAIGYAQVVVDRGRFTDADLAPLLALLREKAGELCTKGLLFPGGDQVIWFAARGGVPPSCN